GARAVKARRLPRLLRARAFTPPRRFAPGGFFLRGGARDHRREVPTPPLPSLPHHAFPLGRRVETRHAPVVGIRLAPDEAFLLERLDDAGHRRRADLLGGCELAERPRPSEHEDGEG